MGEKRKEYIKKGIILIATSLMFVGCNKLGGEKTLTSISPTVKDTQTPMPTPSIIPEPTATPDLLPELNWNGRGETGDLYKGVKIATATNKSEAFEIDETIWKELGEFEKRKKMFTGKITGYITTMSWSLYGGKKYLMVVPEINIPEEGVYSFTTKLIISEKKDENQGENKGVLGQMFQPDRYYFPNDCRGESIECKKGLNKVPVFFDGDEIWNREEYFEGKYEVFISIDPPESIGNDYTDAVSFKTKAFKPADFKNDQNK